MIITWKDQVVVKTHFNRKRDEYYLLDPNDDIVAVLSRPEFLSQPQLRNLPNGRYRRTAPQNHGSASNPAGGPGGIGSLTLAQYAAQRLSGPPPGGITCVNPGPRVRTRLPIATWRGIPVYGLDIAEEAPEPPLRREGIIAGEIIGHRCWRIEDGLLRSVYQQDVWKPKVPLEGRELGDWDSRGIHAWKEVGGHFFDYIRNYLNTASDRYMNLILYGAYRKEKPAMVTGTVYLWGDVVEHERGYRAEFARVRSLDWLYPDADMMGRERIVLDDLKRTYGCLNPI